MLNSVHKNLHQNHRHILSLSGGKDSTALALYMKDKIPDMEFIFCDTGEELPETREYLLKIQAYLGKEIKILNPDRQFEHYLNLYRGVLPDPRTRWCTKMLKIRPFEWYVGNDLVFLYIGIRADESHRKGYISTKPNIIPRFPFVDEKKREKDILQILEDSGLGLPDYYKWRSRSGCYFCFFQQRREWIGLLENHEDLYWKAAKFEKSDSTSGMRFTWIQDESLLEMAHPTRIRQIKQDYLSRTERGQQGKKIDIPLMDIFSEPSEIDDSCLICYL